MKQKYSLKKLLNLFLIGLFIYGPYLETMGYAYAANTGEQVAPAGSNLGSTDQTNSSSSSPPPTTPPDTSNLGIDPQDLVPSSPSVSNVTKPEDVIEEKGKTGAIKKPPEYLNYLYMLVLSLISTSILVLGSPEPQNKMMPLSMDTFSISTIIYIEQEYFVAGDYKEKGEEVIRINKLGSFDRQREQFLNAADVTEKAANAAAFKLQIQKSAMTGIKVASGFAQWELIMKQLEMAIVGKLEPMQQLSLSAFTAMTRACPGKKCVRTLVSYNTSYANMLLASLGCVNIFIKGLYLAHLADLCLGGNSPPHTGGMEGLKILAKNAKKHSHINLLRPPPPKSFWPFKNTSSHKSFAQNTSSQKGLWDFFETHILPVALYFGLSFIAGGPISSANADFKSMGLIGLIVSVAIAMFTGPGWLAIKLVKQPETRIIILDTLEKMMAKVMDTTSKAVLTLTENAQLYLDAAKEIERLKGIKEEQDKKEQEKRERERLEREKRLQELLKRVNDQAGGNTSPVSLPDPQCIKGTPGKLEKDPDCTCKKNNSCFSSKTFNNDKAKERLSHIPVPQSIRSVPLELESLANNLSSGNFAKASAQANSINKKIGNLDNITKKFRAQINRSLKTSGKKPLDFDKESQKFLLENLNKANKIAGEKGLAIEPSFTTIFQETSSSPKSSQQTSTKTQKAPTESKTDEASESKLEYKNVKEVGHELKKPTLKKPGKVTFSKLNFGFGKKDDKELFDAPPEEIPLNGEKLTELAHKEQEKNESTQKDLKKINDINKEAGTGLYEVITERYFQSAYPTFFESN